MEKTGFFRNISPRNTLKALIIGLSGLALTLLSTYYVKTATDRTSTDEFHTICNDISGRIQVRLVAQAQLLRCGAAFFAGSDSVERKNWKIFYENTLIERNLPGIEGLGYSVIIPKDRLKEHIDKVRKEGFPDYTVRPLTDRADYTSILYLEPFEGRNMRAFGYDMFSEPVRRKAMETARDSNLASISGKVVLVQETGSHPQPGTLMYVPVYRNGLPIRTVSERRAAILGWVYSPYRMGDLMQGILGFWEKDNERTIRLRIFDDESLSEESLLYDSQSGNPLLADKELFNLPVELNGNKWYLVFSRTRSDSMLMSGKSFLILVSGLLISMLLFFLAISLFSTQQRAEVIARNLTAEIGKVNDRLSLAARAGRVGIWDWDLVLNKLIWDDQMYALYGISANGFKGAYQSWLEGLHPDDKERGDREIQACLKGEKDFDTEFRVCWPDGSVHFLRAQAVVLRNGDGTPMHLIGTNRDITEQKQREEDLVNAKITADYASHSKSEFLSRMSHELRTPLNAILGFAQLLDIGDLSVSQKRAVQQILGGGKKLLEMINNVLDISSVDAGMLDVVIEKVNVSEILPGVLDDIKPLAFEKRVTIHFSDSLFADGPVLADRIRFRQVMYNLLSNAVKFNREGGQVNIASSRFTRQENGDFIRYSVTDTGQGIREENLKHLFQPFERVEPDQIDYSGRGLGLAVVKKLVLAMNGGYGVESTFGEGSTFWVELPCA